MYLTTIPNINTHTHTRSRAHTHKHIHNRTTRTQCNPVCITVWREKVLFTLIVDCCIVFFFFNGGARRFQWVVWRRTPSYARRRKKERDLPNLQAFLSEFGLPFIKFWSNGKYWPTIRDDAGYRLIAPTGLLLNIMAVVQNEQSDCRVIALDQLQCRYR